MRKRLLDGKWAKMKISKFPVLTASNKSLTIIRVIFLKKNIHETNFRSLVESIKLDFSPDLFSMHGLLLFTA